MQLRLFGGFEWTGGAERLRSGTCEQVLALLATRPSLSRTALADAVWPDSEGDRQSQNLRKALSNIRTCLGASSSALVLEGDRVRLCTETLPTDRTQFLDPANPLVDRWNLYRGPFCEGWEFSWVLAERKLLEREFLRLTELVAGAYLARREYEGAIPFLRAALSQLPLAESLHLLTLQALVGSGRSLEAIQHLEAWELVLDEEYGESPPLEAARILDQLPRAVVQVPANEPYVQRPADKVLHSALVRGETTILIHGPRQTGKSALVGHHVSRLNDKRVVVSDLSELGDSMKGDQRRLYEALAARLAAPGDPPLVWQDWLSPNANLETALKKSLELPLVWVLDPVDALFGSPFQDDLFGLMRSWHNRARLELQSPISRLQLILVYSAEAHLFIRDLNQSPFNVGFAIPVQDFRQEEVALLAGQVGTPSEFVETVLAALGGQPALTRQALEMLRADPDLNDGFYRFASDLDGPFGSHLRRLIGRIRREEELVEAVRMLLRGSLPPDPFLVSRLKSGGLIRRTADGFSWRVPIYRDAFAEMWGETPLSG